MSILSPIACPPANLLIYPMAVTILDYLKSNIGLVLLFLVACIILIPMLWPLYG